MTVLAEYEKVKAEFLDVQARFQERSKTLFWGCVGEIFAAYPGVKSFCWTQYAPYFNDGDPCVFSIHSEGFVNGWDRYGDSDDIEDDTDDKVDPDEEWDAKYNAVNAGLYRFIESIDDDVLIDMFGDDVKVKIFSDGRKVVEEYRHN